MKKLLCLLLVLLMSASLCGCALNFNDIINNISSRQSEKDNDRDDDDDENEKEATEEKENTKEEIDIGTTKNNTYTNEYLGITCKLPKAWNFLTREELLELSNLVVDAVGEDYAEALKNANSIYCMYATNSSTNSNVTVTMEKPNFANKITNANIGVALKTQLGSYEAMYENMGYTDVKANLTTLNVSNQTFTCVKINAKIQGYSFYSTLIFFVKNEYIVSIGAGSLYTDKTEDILSNFTFEFNVKNETTV